MKKKLFINIITTIIYTSIPAFLSYMSSSVSFLPTLVSKGIIGQSINIDLVKDICLILSIILSVVLLSYNLCKTKIQYEDVLTQRNLLIKMNKDNLGIVLSKLSSNFSDFDIRIFIPKWPLLYKIADRFQWSIRKEFIIKNIDLIANQGATKNLSFEISPNPQGLVGECYKSKRMIYDDNLESTNSTNYSLNAGQISRTSNLKWSICCPIIDNNDSVVSIIALDGTKKITIDQDKEKELSDNIFTYSRILYDTVPQLFRRKNV